MNVDDVTIPKFTVIQYVRNKKRIPHGVIVAIKSPEGSSTPFVCGYSICNKKDRFNKKMALKIALGRAEKFGADGAVEPHDVRKMMPAFTDRCKRYYKNGT